MTTPYIENLDEIKAKLDPESVLELLQPGKKNRSGQELRSPCPVHGGDGENFCLNLNTHNWTCHSEGCKGTNLVDLYAQCKKIPNVNTAAAELAEIFGIPIKYKGTIEGNQSTKYSPESVLTCWNEAKPQGNDAYFSRKKLAPPPIAKFGKNPAGYHSTLIPYKNTDGELKLILSLGKGKYEFKAGEPKGTFALLGELNPNGSFYVGEGIATVQTAWEATQKEIPAVSCRSWSNILPVVAAIKAKYPNAKPIILIDCDAGGNGLKAAQLVAQAFPDATFRLPSFEQLQHSGDKKPTDFNDIISKCGQSFDEVRRQLEQPFDISSWSSPPKEPLKEKIQTPNSTEQPKTSTAHSKTHGRCEPARDAIKRIGFLDKIKARVHDFRTTGVSKISGMSTGYTQLDELIDGLQGGHLLILAGRTAMGKTYKVLNILKNIAIDQQLPAALYSLEMSHQQVFYRLASLCSGVPATQIRRGTINDTDLAKVEAALVKIGDSQLFVTDDPANSNFSNLYANMRYSCEEEGAKAIFIDHIGLVNCGSDYRDNRATELGTISMNFKLMAKQYDIPVLCLAQLNRDADSKEPPKLSQLRESGNLEQNADVVIFIHRRDYYDPTDKPGQADIIVAKNREGDTGTVTFGYEKATWLLTELPLLRVLIDQQQKSGSGNGQKTQNPLMPQTRPSS
jgi:KaiC/GvpD/RAD55 family RecA-like ATPase